MARKRVTASDDGKSNAVWQELLAALAWRPALEMKRHSSPASRRELPRTGATAIVARVPNVSPQPSPRQDGDAREASLPWAALDLTLPPELALAFGYRGDARFVGFRWSPLGDQLAYSDGVSSGTGEGWAFLAFKRHRHIAPLLEPFALGSSETDATHWLLIDRKASRAAVVPAVEARHFLVGQHPPEPILTHEQRETIRAEMDRLLQEWRDRPVDRDAVAAEIAEQQRRVARMVAFLDAQVAGPI